MKTTLLPLLLTAVLTLTVCSCEKANLGPSGGDPETGVTDGYTVSLNVAQIERQPIGAGTGATAVALGDVCTRVSYIVLNGNGQVYTTKHQAAGSHPIGSLTLTLPAGSYRVVTVAHSGAGNLSVEGNDKIKFKDNKVTDTYWGTADMTVSGPTDCALHLQRVTARLCVDIAEAMPAQVSRMEFFYTGGSSTLGATTGYGVVNSRQTEVRTVSADMAGRATRFELYTLPHNDTGQLKLTIKALDAQGGTVAQAEYADLPISRNATTTKSVSLFGTTPPEGGDEADLSLSLSAKPSDGPISQCY